MTADVLIVGGGIAGSSLAIMLGRQGINVELFERGHFPREKACRESPGLFSHFIGVSGGMQRFWVLGNALSRASASASLPGPMKQVAGIGEVSPRLWHSSPSEVGSYPAVKEFEACPTE